MPTKAEIALRPELLLGPNPLIERATPFIKFDDLPARLKKSPLEHKDWKSIPPEAREPLLDAASQHLVPTSLVLEPAAGMQRLFRRGLALRNPMMLEERLRTAHIATTIDAARMRELPRLDGAGGLWSSPTGMGKTTLARRVLEVICPEQVVVHDACSDAGWLRLTQCCYLYVDHPSNGTRGGLLKRILLELDRAIFTDYSEQYKRVDNIDTLLVTVCKLLIAHRVALLVIDEKQSRNFLESPWQIEFVLFYLSLMNLGVSVLLLGNSVAFEHLQSFSQVMRRFSIGGPFEFQPAQETDPWWRDELVPGMRKFNLTEKCSIDVKSRTRRENEACAGFPGLLEAFQTEAQRAALRRGGQCSTLGPADFDEALASPRYLALARIARSMRNNSGDFADLPSDDRHLPDGSEAIVKKVSRNTVDVVSSMLGRYKAEQTRLTNSFARKMRALEGLSPEDLRMLGASDDMLAQLIAGSPFSRATKVSKTQRS